MQVKNWRINPMEMPTHNIAAFVIELAKLNNVTYTKTSNDVLDEVITRLSRDDIPTDDTENLIVALKRAHVIDAVTMVMLLDNYFDEKRHGLSGKKMDFLRMTAGNINTSYKTSMSVADLERFMLTGKIEPGFEGQIMHLIDETPTSVVAGAVKQLAAQKNINAKLIWKNLAHVATEIKSPNKFWNAFG